MKNNIKYYQHLKVNKYKYYPYVLTRRVSVTFYLAPLLLSLPFLYYFWPRHFFTFAQPAYNRDRVEDDLFFYIELWYPSLLQLLTNHATSPNAHEAFGYFYSLNEYLSSRSLNFFEHQYYEYLLEAYNEERYNILILWGIFIVSHFIFSFFLCSLFFVPRKIFVILGLWHFILKLPGLREADRQMEIIFKNLHDRGQFRDCFFRNKEGHIRYIYELTYEPLGEDFITKFFTKLGIIKHYWAYVYLRRRYDRLRVEQIYISNITGRTTDELFNEYQLGLYAQRSKDLDEANLDVYRENRSTFYEDTIMLKFASNKLYSPLVNKLFTPDPECYEIKRELKEKIYNYKLK